MKTTGTLGKSPGGFGVVDSQFITDEEFNQIRDLIYEKAGISMSPVKKTLVVSRLSKRLRHYGFSKYSQYYDMVVKGNAVEEMQVMIDLLTTNETYFFREEKHFDFIQREVLTKWPANKKLRAWSAACSRGQEPYTLAMVLADYLGVGGNWEIQATDISSKVLKYAREGSYPIDEAKNIPKKYLSKYCLKGIRSQEGTLLIDRALRSRIEYFPLNLNAPWPDLGKYSVIMLRNVMIYFDVNTKAKLVNRLYQLLEPGGYLLIGHSETLSQINTKLSLVRPSIYRRNE
jgi:chemotaxis protein methyltransferase CheR